MIAGWRWRRPCGPCGARAIWLLTMPHCPSRSLISGGRRSAVLGWRSSRAVQTELTRAALGLPGVALFADRTPARQRPPGVVCACVRPVGHRTLCLVSHPSPADHEKRSALGFRRADPYPVICLVARAPQYSVSTGQRWQIRWEARTSCRAGPLVPTGKNTSGTSSAHAAASSHPISLPFPHEGIRGGCHNIRAELTGTAHREAVHSAPVRPSSDNGCMVRVAVDRSVHYGAP